MSSTPTRSGGRHRLVVLRHAKAESFAPDDAARRLTDRGRADAAARGRWLAERAGELDLALVSTATRARETWELAAGELPAPPELRLDEGLYNASPDAVLDLLRALPESVGSVVYVGHNPTAASLALLLHDGSGDPAAFDTLSGGLPPGGVAVYDVAGPWQDLDAGTGSLVAVDA
jgi:phosphohistidine phosphatase